VFELIAYETPEGHRPYEIWLRSLKDKMAKVRIMKRTRQIETGNLGDYASVGEGVMEFRFHFGPGYRVYFARSGTRLIILLCGGEKSSQANDIERAKEYWADWKSRSL
jgi:putative addiction module killer protein